MGSPSVSAGPVGLSASWQAYQCWVPGQAPVGWAWKCWARAHSRDAELMVPVHLETSVSREQDSLQISLTSGPLSSSLPAFGNCEHGPIPASTLGYRSPAI